MQSGGEEAGFRLADPQHRLAGVRLALEVRLPGDELDFAPADGGWVLVIPRPDVDRLEYRFELTHVDGTVEEVCDPANPLQVPAASPAYARALVTEVLPTLPPTTCTIGMGASLGGLALLHAHRSFPRAFDALFLQSGSFFHPEHDAHEAPSRATGRSAASCWICTAPPLTSDRFRSR